MADTVDRLQIEITADASGVKSELKSVEKQATATKKNIENAFGSIGSGSQIGKNYGQEISKSISASLKGTSFAPLAGAMSASMFGVIASIKLGVADLVDAMQSCTSITVHYLREVNGISQGWTNVSEELDNITDIMDANRQFVREMRESIEGTTTATQEMADTEEKVSKATRETTETMYEEGTISEGLITKLARRIGLHESMLKAIKSALTTTEGLKSLFQGINGEVQHIVSGITGFSNATREILTTKKPKTSTAEQLEKEAKLQKQISQMESKQKHNPDLWTEEDQNLLDQLSVELMVVQGEMDGATTKQSMLSGAFQAVSGIIKGTLIPSLSALWTALAPILLPVLAVIVAIKVQLMAIKAVVAVFKKYFEILGTKLKIMATAIKEYYKYFFKALGGAGKALITGAGKAFEALGNIIQKVVEEAKEGLSNMYQWAKSSGDKFADSIDTCNTALSALQNGIITVVAPLINQLAPAIEVITAKFVELINVISRFFAMLTGASGFYKLTQSVDEYAESAGGASKATKSLTTGIDELNVLSDDSSSGGSSSSSTGGATWTWEDLGGGIVDPEFLGNQLGLKIKWALEAIDWDSIQSKFGEVGSTIAEFFNGMLSVSDLGETLGSTLSNALNAGIEFFKGLSEIDGEKLGEQISGFVVGAFETFDTQGLQEAVSGLISDIADAINGVFSTDNGASQAISEGLGTMIGNGVNDVADFITELNWDDITTTVANTLKTAIETANPDKIADAICTLLGAGWNLLMNLPLAELATKAGQVLNRILEKATAWFSDEGNQTELTNKLSGALNALIDAIEPEKVSAFINSLVVWFGNCWEKMRQKINWQNLGQKLGNMLASVDWGAVLKLCFTVITGIWDFAHVFVRDVWTPLAKAICSALHAKIVSHVNEILGLDEDSNVGELIVKGLRELVDSAVANLNPFYAIIHAIDLIKDAYDTLKEYIEEHPITFEVEYAGDTVEMGAGTGWGLGGYASGGYPDMGQMFVAREAGPELVGTIGNHTAVMNNEQIVEAVSSGVYSAVKSAMSGSGSQSINVYLDGKQIESSVRQTSQRRGVTIASGGLINYAYA